MLPPPCAISSQFLSVVRRLRIDLVDRLDAQQRFEAGDDRQRQRGGPHRAVADRGEIGEGEQVDEARQAVGDRHLHQMRRAAAATPGDRGPSSALPPTPISTTTSGPGRKRSGPSFGRAPSHQNRKARLTTAISDRAGRHARGEAACQIAVKVLPPSAVENSKLPSNRRRHSRRACGICFRIRISPIAASMPVMTDDGTNSARMPARGEGEGDLDHAREHDRQQEHLVTRHRSRSRRARSRSGRRRGR